MSLVQDKYNFYDVDKNWDTHFPSLFSKLELAIYNAGIDGDFDYANHMTPAEALVLISHLMCSFDAYGDITMGKTRIKKDQNPWQK